MNDPRRNSFFNLIGFVETGVNVPLEGAATAPPRAGAGVAVVAPMETVDEDAHRHHKAKKDKKKKKQHAATTEEEPIIVQQRRQQQEEEAPVVEKKKKKKKKDKGKGEIEPEPEPEKDVEKQKKKKKKKKDKDNNSNDDDGCGGGEADDDSAVELDSDDDLSLGSIPMSSSSDDEEDDEDGNGDTGNPTLSTVTSRRVSMVDGLKGFQVNYKPEAAAAAPARTSQQVAISKQRRHTLGNALKGFQINLVQDDSTQQQDNNHLDGLAGITKNLPKLSIATVAATAKQGTSTDRRRRESAYAAFMNKDSSNKDHHNSEG